MQFTELRQQDQFAILAFAVFLAFVVFFGFMVSSAQASESIFETVWELKNPPAKKPYVYLVVRDADRVCRQIGAKPMYAEARMNGCFIVKNWSCLIYLQEDASSRLFADVVAHEEKHCAGYVHD